jgi:RNA polymerase sigma factor (sigma-70 family)
VVREGRPRQTAGPLAANGSGAKRGSLTDAEVEALLATWEAYAWKLAIRWKRKNPAIDLEDLHGEVRMGFVEAARRWEPDRGLQFSTYATWWGDRYARDLVRREAARGMHVPQHEGIKALDVWDIDVRTPGQDDRPLSLAVAPEPEWRPEFPADFWERIERVLTAKQYEVIRLHFRDGLALVEIGRRLGVSRGYAWMMLRHAIPKLRDRLPGMVEHLRERADEPVRKVGGGAA